MARTTSRTVLVLLLGINLLCIVSSNAQSPGHFNSNGQPTLIFSTYLGGTQCGCDNPRTFAQNAASDHDGNTYVTGATRVTDLPVLHAFQSKPAPHAEMSGFVAKFDPTGKLLWLTYLGGNQQTTGVGIAALPDGGVAVDGVTSSNKPEPFPTTSNAYQTDYAGGAADYFVSIFDKDGHLRYSTYLGGSIDEGTGFEDNTSNGNNLAADANGLVYLAGTTNSGGSPGETQFPITANAVQPSMNGDSDAILVVIDPSKTGSESLLYSSFLGGSGSEKGHGATVDATGGFITVAGYTGSDDFPTTKHAYRKDPPAKGWTSIGFVAQFTSSKPGDPSSEYKCRYATYLGGKSDKARDDIYGLTTDTNGVLSVTGRTLSPDYPTTWPTVYHDAPFVGVNRSGDMPYMAKLDPSKEDDASLAYGTFLGGAEPADQGGNGGFTTAIGVDSRGNTSVAGESSTDGIEYTYGAHSEASEKFPYTHDALIKHLPSNTHVIVMQVAASGAWFSYSTYLGGSGYERAYGLAVDPSGNVVVTGLTTSPDFPVKNPAEIWPHTPNGTQNAFITKFSFGQ